MQRIGCLAQPPSWSRRGLRTARGFAPARAGRLAETASLPDGREPAAAGFPLSAAASPLGRHGTGHRASLGTRRRCGGCRGWFDLPSGALERSPRRQQGRLPRHSWGPGRSTFPFLHLFLRVHSSAVGARGVASGSLGRGRAALTGLRPPEG